MLAVPQAALPLLRSPAPAVKLLLPLRRMDYGALPSTPAEFQGRCLGALRPSRLNVSPHFIPIPRSSIFWFLHEQAFVLKFTTYSIFCSTKSNVLCWGFLTHANGIVFVSYLIPSTSHCYFCSTFCSSDACICLSAFLLRVCVGAICSTGLINSVSQFVGVLVFGFIRGFCYYHKDRMKEINTKITKSQHFNAKKLIH